MRYLHREIPEGKTYDGSIAEDPNVQFSYICTENATEENCQECSDDIEAWRTLFKDEGLLGEEYSVQTTGRFYLAKDKWYGVNSTYGFNYYQFNTAYNSYPAVVKPSLQYYASGIHVRKSGFLKSVRLMGEFNKGDMDIHFAINAQTKFNKTTTAENRVIYHDATPRVELTEKGVNYVIDLNVNREVFEGEVITLLMNRSDTKGSTKYMYVDLIDFIFE